MVDSEHIIFSRVLGYLLLLLFWRFWVFLGGFVCFFVFVFVVCVCVGGVWLILILILKFFMWRGAFAKCICVYMFINFI